VTGWEVVHDRQGGVGRRDCKAGRQCVGVWVVGGWSGRSNLLRVGWWVLTMEWGGVEGERGGWVGWGGAWEVGEWCGVCEQAGGGSVEGWGIDSGGWEGCGSIGCLFGVVGGFARWSRVGGLVGRGEGGDA